MKQTPAVNLMGAVGLAPGGLVPWGTPAPAPGPGVYIISTPEPLAHAPIDTDAVATWLARVPTLRVDGRRPDVKELSERLAEMWVPEESIVYIGRTGSSIRGRVRAFYRTPLGDPRPHAGGHWLKVLSNLTELEVTWAETEADVADERALIEAFSTRHEGRLPFANRQSASGIPKVHGISGSTLDRVASTRSTGAAPGPPRAGRAVSPKPGGRRDLTAINAALQRMACAAPDREVRAVEAARRLEELGLLADSASRPGKPLRELLRAGLIEHARQDGNWWFIECRQ